MIMELENAIILKIRLPNPKKFILGLVNVISTYCFINEHLSVRFLMMFGQYSSILFWLLSELQLFKSFKVHSSTKPCKKISLAE